MGTLSSARIAFASYNCLPRPTCTFLFTTTFFCFFFHTYFPSRPILGFIGLCLVPLDDTNTYGFVFPSMALLQACLLLNSAGYASAVHIQVALFALSLVR